MQTCEQHYEQAMAKLILSSFRAMTDEQRANEDDAFAKPSAPAKSKATLARTGTVSLLSSPIPLRKSTDGFGDLATPPKPSRLSRLMANLTPVVSPISTPLGRGSRMIPGQTGLRYAHLVQRRVSWLTRSRNLGNTCFMNSIVQAISHVSMFREYLTFELIPESGKAVPVSNRFITRSDTIECLQDVRAKSRIKMDEVCVV